MFSYYIFASMLTFLALFSSRMFLMFLVVGCVFFLVVLPSTGFDYDYYKQAFDGSYWVYSFPWFKTDGVITAEPLYLWYNSLVAVLLPISFPWFLAFNFCLCCLLSFFAIKSYKGLSFGFFWLALLPVIFPTIFYFSPRSSISFFLVLAGVFYLARARFLFSAICLVLGMLLHSQYILFVFFIVLSYFVFRGTRNMAASSQRKAGMFVLVVMALMLVTIDLVMTYIVSFLGWLPSADVAVSKLHYLEGSRGGVRITAIMSIIIYPACFWALTHFKAKSGYKFISNNDHDEAFTYLLMMSVFFGCVINLVYFGTPHLAGRLSRFSDYLSMGVIVPSFLLLCVGRQLTVFALLFLCVIAPFIYPTVYNF